MPSPIHVLDAHPGLGFGGSEARVLWGLVALRGTGYELHLATGRPFDLKTLNRHCGTDLRPEEFTPHVAPAAPRRLLGHTDALRGAVFARYLRKVAGQFDVCISAYNIADFGKPAIQFIADFSFDDELRRELDPAPPGPRSWAHRPGWLRRAYLGFAGLIAGRSGYDGRQDWLVANSRFTADVLKSRRGVDCHSVIYPPVVCDAPDVPWSQRENGFVCLGRVSPEKRIDRMIDIVARVRARGHDVHLHVIGPIGGDAYGRMIARKIAGNAGWCFAEGGKSGREKFELLARHRWAIHGREGEAFGIAVVEQVKSGCIPFVPDSGGPVEIVNESSLCYRDEEDAAAKIDAVLRDEARQQHLRAHLAEQGRRFGTDVFCREFRQVVEDFIRERGHGATKRFVYPILR